MVSGLPVLCLFCLGVFAPPQVKAQTQVQVQELALPPIRGMDFAAPRLDPGLLPSVHVDEIEESGLRLIALALSWLGTPYMLGGRDASGMDCSGLLFRILLEAYPGLGLPPRRSEDFAKYGEAAEEIRPGDILLFAEAGSIYHVGLALGQGFFIHSASEGERRGVIISNLEEGSWRSRLFGARRIKP